MAETLTLMAVHAHPDDEASSTGGVLARYSAEGVRTVVVTCTNGEFGDAPGQVKPGQDGHDEEAVARLRLSELRQSCKLLGVSHLELLGYHDSGMPEWDYRSRSDAFCNVPQELVAARMSAYQHPDHVHAARSAAAAVASSGSVAKFYQTAMRRSDWQKIMEALRDAGEDVSEWGEMSPEEARKMADEEARITTTIDISDVLPVKRDALMSHASQIADSWFSKIPPDIAAQAFGRESFTRVKDTTGAPVPENDLFAGLRG
jgi:LmbE family N-acetylglucosaminyl deacetylase